MRRWPNPWGGSRICSISGSSIRSVRVPNHKIGPCENEEEFNNHLIRDAYAGTFSSEAEYQATYACAKKVQSMPHQVMFSHGDLKHHNIMIHEGHITGFLDWESAGWYPSYWEFTTTLRFTFEDTWWFDFVLKLGGDEYLAELECERALTSLTSLSYSW
jgi:hypothetical protein